jgi:TetR/AcrR family transcriptional regulator, transcriptional repressor for nem operon
MLNQDPPSTRERLVGAALQLFAAKGYAATSIAEVLREAGANSGSLYYFFPAKQDLLLAVLEAYRQGIGPMLLEPAWRDVPDPVERIFALLARYRYALEASACTYGCPIGSLALELHEPDPAVRQALAANFTAWIDAIVGCLEQARARLPADVDLRGLAELVLAVMEGGVMLARTQRDIACFDRAVAQLRRHFAALARAAAPSRHATRRMRRKNPA